MGLGGWDGDGGWDMLGCWEGEKEFWVIQERKQFTVQEVGFDVTVTDIPGNNNILMIQQFPG